MNRTEKTPRELELEALLKSVGRPTVAMGFASLCRAEGAQPSELVSPFAVIRMSLARAREWDAANPSGAAEYKRISAELEAEVRRADREFSSRLSAERSMRMLAVKLERSGAGERSLEAARNPKQTESMDVARRWLEDRSKSWLVLVGDKGVGKSVAALWAMWQVMREDGTGARVDAARIARLSQFDAGAEELEWLKRVDLLVVDDMGAELMNDYARSRFHELFDARHEAYGRTIITSNLMWKTTTRDGTTIPGLADRLGERIVDRIAQAGTIHQLSKSQSLRRAASEAH